MDRFTQLGLSAALQAAAEADVAACDPERVAVILGTGVGGLGTLQEQCTSFLDRGERGVSPNCVPMMMPNAAAGVVAMRLGLHGPGFSIASACATGSHAIGEGMRMIERGAADVVLAGGSEAALTTLCLAAFRRMGALSVDGVSRPFDARRDGFVMGEGAAVLVLESEQHALARGAKVFARVVGYGASNDAFDMVQPDEFGDGALKAMNAALAPGVAELMLDRAEAMNAINTSTALRLAQACAELAKDRQVQAVVLDGTLAHAPSAWAPTSRSATGCPMPTSCGSGRCSGRRSAACWRCPSR